MINLHLSKRPAQLLRIRSIITARARRSRRRSVVRKFESGEYEFESTPHCLCGGESFQPIADKDRDNIPVGVKLCKKCGMGVQSPRLTQDALRLFYQRDYRKLLGLGRIGTADFERGRRRGQRIMDFLKAQSLELERINVVEIGCGSGGILKWFQEHGNTVLGCEFDRQCLARGNSKGITILEGDLQVIVESRIKANLIILSHLVEHLSRPIEFVTTLRGILADGGAVYVEVPGIRNPTSDFFRGMQVAHLYYYDLVTLRWLMSKAGFGLVAGNETVQSVFRTGMSEERVQLHGNFEQNVTVIKNWSRDRAG